MISPALNGYFLAYIDPFFTCTQYPQGRVAPPTSGRGQAENYTKEVNYFKGYETTFKKSDEFKNKKLSVNIYPTPFTDKLNIEYTIESSQNVTISICTLSGQELIQLKNKFRHDQGIYKLEFNGINLSAGTYLLKINTDNNSVTKRIIKNQ